MLKRAFFQHFCLTYTPQAHPTPSPCTVVSVRKRGREGLNTFSNSQVNPPLQMCHLINSRRAEFRDACLVVLVKTFLIRAQALFLCLAKLKPRMLRLLMHMCGNRQEGVTSFEKQQGDEAGREIRNTCYQSALKQEFEYEPAHFSSAASF